MSLGVEAVRSTPMRLLVVTGADVASPDELPPSIRVLIEAASDLLVVTPTLPTKLQWLTNDTDAYQQVADQRLNAVLGHVQEINADATAEGHVGADDAITAFTDAVNEFHPDHILIGLHATDQETWQEHGLADAVIGSHKEVLERTSVGRSEHVLVFENLPEGEYTLWIDNVATNRDVRVVGGAIAEVELGHTAQELTAGRAAAR